MPDVYKVSSDTRNGQKILHHASNIWANAIAMHSDSLSCNRGNQNLMVTLSSYRVIKNDYFCGLWMKY